VVPKKYWDGKNVPFKYKESIQRLQIGHEKYIIALRDAEERTVRTAMRKATKDLP